MMEYIQVNLVRILTVIWLIANMRLVRSQGRPQVSLVWKEVKQIREKSGLCFFAKIQRDGYEDWVRISPLQDEIGEKNRRMSFDMPTVDGASCGRNRRREERLSDSARDQHRLCITDNWSAPLPLPKMIGEEQLAEICCAEGRTRADWLQKLSFVCCEKRKVGF